ncbi:MAG: UDP-3-O-(3-hydroxymyristoyl)glucosamine N-acyltransferase [Candidatus Omnitrophica bacterium]|nr:UDP-3-O-(3-hydroxymyristoyl)glucosamine N-acyltransferase [Candidatus Omnitrophota bacterium]
MGTITLEKLAKELDGALKNADGKVSVSGIRDIEEAESGDIAFVFKKEPGLLPDGIKASCVVVSKEPEKNRAPVIICKNLNLAFKKAVELILPPYPQHPRGIHKTAHIGEGVKLGKDVTLGAYTVIEDGCEVGDNSVIYPHCYVGTSSVIGSDSIVYPNVTIREKVKIGNRVIIHPGSVIGSDGYGYERTPAGHAKIPQIGDVIIEDDVEIGSCVTVDRAKVSHTRIGRGSKIDNLVQIAHNVTIGGNCIIAAQCGISGSVKIGNNVMMGGQVGITDHAEIGDNTMIGAKGGVTKSVPANSIIIGIPARPIKSAKMSLILIDKLPEIYKRLRAIENKIGIK